MLVCLKNTTVEFEYGKLEIFMLVLFCEFLNYDIREFLNLRVSTYAVYKAFSYFLLARTLNQQGNNSTLTV